MAQGDIEGGYTPDDLMPGVQHWESGGRRYAVSPKGAIGLYQIMPDTAAMFGYSAQDMFDPAKNEDVARKYLGQLLQRYNGNAYMALAAYNTGPGNVDKGILPAETQQYVHNVLGYTRDFGQGKKAGTAMQARRTATDPMQAQLDAIQAELKGWDAQVNAPSTNQLAAQAAPPPMSDAQFLGSVLLNSMFGRYGGQMTGDKFPGEAPLTTVQPGPMSGLFRSTVGRL